MLVLENLNGFVCLLSPLTRGSVDVQKALRDWACVWSRDFETATTTSRVLKIGSGWAEISDFGQNFREIQ